MKNLSVGHWYYVRMAGDEEDKSIEVVTDDGDGWYTVREVEELHGGYIWGSSGNRVGCGVLPSPSERERVGVRVGQGVLNRLQHRLQIAQHSVIPEPEHPIASVHEGCRTSPIGENLGGMVATIDLHHEPVCRTPAIYTVWTDGILTAKRGVMDLSVTHLPPQHPLTVGLPPAKPSGEPPAPSPLTLPLSPSGGRGGFITALAPFGGGGAFTRLAHGCYPHEFRKSLF